MKLNYIDNFQSLCTTIHFFDNFANCTTEKLLNNVIDTY